MPLAELPGRVGKLIEERKEAQKQIDELRSKRSSGGVADDLFAKARAIASQDGAKAISGVVEDVDAKAMRTMVDDYKNRLGSGVVCLAAASGAKALIAIGVTKDLTGSFKAGDLIREVAAVVGGGGGAPGLRPGRR